MSTNLRAARAIALAATSPTEAREFLEMLGLLDDNGRIAPDESRRPIRPDTHKPVVRGSHFADKPKQSTAPQALRVLAPIVPVKAVAAPKPKKVKSVAEGRKSRAVPKKRQRSECGTVAGYKRHYREHTAYCEPCRAAAKVDRDARRKPTPRKERTSVLQPCGTNAAFHAHRRRNEPVCEPCRIAHNAQQRDLDRRRAEAAGRPFIAKSTGPVECGTTRGYYWHTRRGEAPCGDCAAARYQQQKVARALRAEKRAA